MNRHKEIRDSQGVLVCRVEFFDEHHMASEHIEIVSMTEVEGISRYFTTNGRVLLSSDETVFLIQDASTILAIHREQKTVTHYSLPDSGLLGHKKDGWFLGNVIETKVGLELMSYCSSGEKRTELKRLAGFDEGFGVVSEGVFPSAYGPMVEARKQLLKL